MSKSDQKKPEKIVNLGEDITLLMGNTFYAIMFAFILTVLLTSKRIIYSWVNYDIIILHYSALIILAFYFFIDWVDTNLSATIDKEIGYKDVGLRLLCVLVLAFINLLVINVGHSFEWALLFTAIYHGLTLLLRDGLFGTKKAAEKAKDDKKPELYHHLTNLTTLNYILIFSSVLILIFTVFYILDSWWGLSFGPLEDDWSSSIPNVPTFVFFILWIITFAYKIYRSRVYLAPAFREATRRKMAKQN